MGVLSKDSPLSRTESPNKKGRIVWKGDTAGRETGLRKVWKGDTVQKEKRLVSMNDLSGRETRFRKVEVSAQKTALPHQHRRV